MKDDANAILCRDGANALRQRFDRSFSEPASKGPNGSAHTPGNGGDAEPWDRGAPEIGAEKRAPTLRVVSAAVFDGVEPPPRPWIVPEMIPDRTVTMAGGDGAVGKSTLLLQLAVATSVGKEWIGTLPEQGVVVFLSAEDDEDELHRRIAMIAKALSVPIAELADLHLVLLAGCDAVLAAPEGKAAIITPTAVWRALVELVTTLRPRLVILDTLADVFAGNENARAEARQFIGLLRGLAIDHNLAVVLVSHPSLTGMASGSGTSGSTAWNNSVRSRLYLESVKADDGREIDADLRVLRVMKSNYARAGTEIRLRWRDGCFVVDVSAGSFAKIAADASAEALFLDLLAAFAIQGRDVSPNPSRTYAPAVFEAHPRAGGVTKRVFASAMERLLAADRIAVETIGPPSRQYKRLAISQEKDAS